MLMTGRQSRHAGAHGGDDCEKHQDRHYESGDQGVVESHR